MPSCVNFLRTQPMRLVPKTTDTCLDCCTFCCCNKKWPNCSELEGSSSRLLSDNIWEPSLHWVAIFPFTCLRHKVHFRTNIPYQSMIPNGLIYKIPPKSECSHSAYHRGLFNWVNPICTLPLGFSSSLIARNKEWLFLNSYRQQCLLHTRCLRSIQYLEVTLQASWSHSHWDTGNMLTWVNSTGTLSVTFIIPSLVIPRSPIFSLLWI